MAIQRPLTSVARLSIAVMVVYLPLSSIFGLALQWRTLLLVPFFAMASAELLEVRQLRWFAVAVALLAAVYVSDPTRTDLIHNNQSASAQSLESQTSVAANEGVNGASADARNSGEFWSRNCASVDGGLAKGCIPLSMTGEVEKPGPSASLFATPFYSCVRNFYVAANGSDANPGTQEQPWRTIRHADLGAGGRTAGAKSHAGETLRRGGATSSTDVPSLTPAR
jgi:hypothetical protein